MSPVGQRRHQSVFSHYIGVTRGPGPFAGPSDGFGGQQYGGPPSQYALPRGLGAPTSAYPPMSAGYSQGQSGGPFGSGNSAKSIREFGDRPSGGTERPPRPSFTTSGSPGGSPSQYALPPGLGAPTGAYPPMSAGYSQGQSGGPFGSGNSVKSIREFGDRPLGGTERPPRPSFTTSGSPGRTNWKFTSPHDCESRYNSQRWEDPSHFPIIGHNWLSWFPSELKGAVNIRSTPSCIPKAVRSQTSTRLRCP